MKRADFTVILNGLELVARTFIRINGSKIDHTWQNSSLNSVSKSLITSAEENLSTVFTYPGKSNPVINIATEIKERGSMVTESIKQYAVYTMTNQKTIPKSEELSIDHPIIYEDLVQAKAVGHSAEKIDYMPKHNVESSEMKTEQQSEIKLSTPSNIATNSVDSSFKEVNVKDHDMEAFKMANVQEPKIQVTKLGNDFIAEKLKPNIETSSNQKLPKTHKLQRLSDRARERKVPSSRISRLMSYGGLAAGMGLGAVAEMARRTFNPKLEKDADANNLLYDNPFLSEANANRIVDTLCKVRGAALKLGQMLSIQDNAMINPQLAAIFERVRQSADFMPSWQMEKVLRNELGFDWQSKFCEFDPKPFAAASIGQVHTAKLQNGTDIAIKIQYPGVAEGIESDIKSLMSIVNLWNILPKALYLENVMAVAKRELKKEVDYLNEAKSGKKFKELLKPYPEFYVPEVYEELSTPNILTTELVYGTAVDKIKDCDQETRNKVCENLLKLCLREVFIFRFMQTDPNWANFLYNFDTGQIVLLDFGACNEYTTEFVATYMNIIKAAADQDRNNVLRYSQELGFLTGYETKIMEEAHIDAVMILGEAFACKKPFNFQQQNMTHRIHELVPIMLKHRLTPPPDETYSLHRKMSGIFLLCTKLGAVIDCSKLFDEVYEQYIKQ
ncbi:atypical kinase COQ8B, mitochondrial-like [Uloborus diversus]|uniref:atypical kinase COQ8B, mitochondrial-like n=1 Tax=Uloborus diversus TaxID=327109 RepID=UPI00240A4E1C|nr:atypical kinase COQ8B, mitochondrial-like [Uloborus diversus]